MSKKIPISFNNKELAQLNKLIDLLGLTDVYGAVPQTVKISIPLAILWVNYIAEFIPLEKPDKIKLLLATVEKLKLAEFKARERQQLEKKLDTV